MHFALPPRKTSIPPPYARVSAKSIADVRRKRVQLISYVVLGLLTIYGMFRWLGTARTVAVESRIPSTSKVLIVTVTDKKTMSEDYIRLIKANRDAYAELHGYETFYTDVSVYSHLTNPSPSSWALIPALRNALTLHPKVDYIWSLSADALIMNTTVSLHSHLFGRLSDLMLKDIPVVPPDSVIHTFSHLTASQAYLIISQDIDNLAHTSFMLRNTPDIPQPRGQATDSWSHFFLDAWFDPLYRNYAFQKAENHALEHLVQWHPTILAKLVIVDQRVLNSYNHQAPTVIDPDRKEPRKHDSMWQSGDLLVNFKGCREQELRDCEKEMKEYYTRWKQQFGHSESSGTGDGKAQHEDSTPKSRPLPVIAKSVDKQKEKIRP